MSLHLCQDEGTDPLPAQAHARLLEVSERVGRAHELPAEVDLVLIDDGYMSRLNATYRGMEGATDVLSFDLGSTPGQANTDRGEIYISLPQAKRQAAALAVPLLEELSRLLVHGLLHLAGWVHDTREQLEIMERETETFIDAVDMATTL